MKHDEGMRKVRDFLRRQVRDIRQEGLRALLRKMVMSVDVTLALPLVLLARLLRPLVLIRFGGLPTGGLASVAILEVYLCECKAGLHGRRFMDLFCIGEPICNPQLKKMWERVLHVSRFVRALERVNRWLPGGQRNRIPFRRLQARDIHGLLARTPLHLSFTPEETANGRASLRRLGISEEVPFVCFHARDSAYWSVTCPRRPNNDHDHEYRNSDIRTYFSAVEKLVGRGHTAIRMGAIVKEPLATTNPQIIDYATTARTDFLDVFLCAHCRFFLGDGSGLIYLAMAFRRPMAMVNCIPLEDLPTWNPYDLSIPKKLWLRSERRLLTFPEILKSGIGRLRGTDQYQQREIEVINNAPEEIAALAVEMDERLKGTWRTSEDDEELQHRFWSLFTPNELNGGLVHSRIGAVFLREHRELLDADAVRTEHVV